MRHCVVCSVCSGLAWLPALGLNLVVQVEAASAWAPAYGRVPSPGPKGKGAGRKCCLRSEGWSADVVPRRCPCYSYVRRFPEAFGHSDTECTRPSLPIPIVPRRPLRLGQEGASAAREGEGTAAQAKDVINA